MNKYFIYDPDGYGLSFFNTIEERDSYVERVLDDIREEAKLAGTFEPDYVEGMLIGTVDKQTKVIEVDDGEGAYFDIDIVEV